MYQSAIWAALLKKLCIPILSVPRRREIIYTYSLALLVHNYSTFHRIFWSCHGWRETVCFPWCFMVWWIFSSFESANAEQGKLARKTGANYACWQDCMDLAQQVDSLQVKEKNQVWYVFQGFFFFFFLALLILNYATFNRIFWS